MTVEINVGIITVSSNVVFIIVRHQMSLDIDEVRSVSEYNDFLDVEADP